MCLGVPGKVAAIDVSTSGLRMGTVNFGGIHKHVCLEYVPDVEIGDYVVVHVGFAISKVDEAEARKVFAYLRAMGELSELDIPQPG
jgi:hydrogenase expression/formation protein HypC